MSRRRTTGMARAGLAAGLVLLLGFVAGCGGDSSDNAEPTPDASLVAVSDLDMSAELILYEADDGNADIRNLYLLDPNTGERARLTEGSNLNAGAAFSPDGQTIVFVSNRDGQTETDIYTMTRSGTGVQRITNSPDQAEYEPRFSPDGTTIAYVREDGDDWVLSLMDADGSNSRDLTSPQQFIEFPTWAPDGSRLVFAGVPADGTDAPDIYGVSASGGELQLVVGTKSTDVCPHFTRDGRVMLYATLPEGGKQLDVFARDANSTDTTGASDRRITTDPSKDDYGKPGAEDRIVFVSERDGNPEIYVMNFDGSDQRRLTNTPGLRENLPWW